MGKVIKELSSNNIKMNITAVYIHKQTKRILSKIKKNLTLLFQFLLEGLGDVGRDQFQK